MKTRAPAKQDVAPKAPAPAPQRAEVRTREVPREGPLDVTRPAAWSAVVDGNIAAQPPRRDGTFLVDGAPVASQLTKSEFLVQLKAGVVAVVEAELAGTGWTAEHCPYLEYWFGYYAGRSAADVEASLRKYVPRAAESTTAHDYVEPTLGRVRDAVRRWRATGVVDAPQAIMPPVIEAVTELGVGRSLDSTTRTRLEGALGTDLSSTRIHADALGARASSAAGARAMAIGSHVAFADGEYVPGTHEGDALLAHELAHTVQQRDAVVPASPAQQPLETSADNAAIGGLAKLWGGATALANLVPRSLRAAGTGLQLQRCKLAKAPSDLDSLSLAEKAAWITKAMGDDAGLADREIAKVFASVKSPAEFVELQKLLDMKRVLKFEGNFGAMMIGTLGPVIDGTEILNTKRIAFVEEMASYSVPVAEVFIVYMLEKMYTDDMRVVLAGLAARKSLDKSLKNMPTAQQVIAARGLVFKDFKDRKGTAGDFASALGSDLLKMAKPQKLSDDELNSKFMTVLEYEKLLPPEYQTWLNKTINAVMQQHAEQTFSPSNIVLGTIDYVSFGVPLGLYNLVTGTGKGLYHLGTGDYETAGHELAGAILVLVTYGTIKGYSVVRKKVGASGAAAGAVDDVVLSVEGEALARRLLDDLGADRVRNVAGYIRADSQAARFAAEHGEAGIRALDKAKGNVAAARAELPAIQQQIAVREAAAAKAEAAKGGVSASSPASKAVSGEINIAPKPDAPPVPISPKHGYKGEWPPPEPGPRPPATATADQMADWRYRRHAHDEFAKKHKLPHEILTREGYAPHAKAAATPNARPGRGGGPAQKEVREGPAAEAGYQNTETVQLGERWNPKKQKTEKNMVDGVKPNDKGGTDYLEVDKINADGLPHAGYRDKLKTEIAAMKPGDSLEFWDKTDSSRRIRYEYGDAPSVVDTRRAPPLPTKPRTRRKP